MQRRQFLTTTAALSAAALSTAAMAPHAAADDSDMPFKLSLAEWSLHRTLRDESKDVTNLDFPRLAKELEIDAIEYVNQFFKDKADDKQYLADLQQRCDDHGVTSVLIMVDGEGQLGDPDDNARKQAVQNHRKWLDAAKFLGCHSIRVNAGSRGPHSEQRRLAADGLRQLSELAQPMGLNVIVENHGGWSSDADWLVATILDVGMANCGTLPDFGNFFLSRGDNPIEFDRYEGVEKLMPLAKAVSAKTHHFDDQGNETNTDYARMMEIVLRHDYHSHVGIEWEGSSVDEMTGIRLTRDLLRKVGHDLA